MTGPVKHAENAVKARRELEAVKTLSSLLIRELVALIRAMYLFGPKGLELMSFDGRECALIVADLEAATTAQEMLAAFRKPDEGAA